MGQRLLLLQQLVLSEVVFLLPQLRPMKVLLLSQFGLFLHLLLLLLCLHHQQEEQATNDNMNHQQEEQATDDTVTMMIPKILF